MNNVRNVALSMALFVVSIGLVIAAASIFIATLTPLTIAVWLVTLLLAFLCGLCVWRVTAIKHEREQGQAIDVTPQPAQLPAPQWIPMSANTLTRSGRLDAEARRVAQVLRDADAPPTRESIKAHTDVQGNEAIRLIVARWQRWNWVTATSQGVACEWVEVQDETTNDY